MRVKKVVTGSNAVTTVSVRSGGQVLAEYDNGAAAASPTREYLYGNNLLAIVTGSSGGSGGTIVYQQRDHLSPRLYTDVNGNDVGEQGTFPFGESWYNNSATSSWVFTTYERDAESGNDYALARSYANINGRFLAPDPLEGGVGDPQSWNRYAYVENDPINLSDPSGQGLWEDLGFAIADIFLTIIPGAQSALPIVLGVEAGAEAGNVAVTLDDGTQVIGPWGGSGSAHPGERVWALSRNGPWYPENEPVPTCGDCDGIGTGDAAGQGTDGGGATTAASGPTSAPGGSIWDECGTGCMNGLARAGNFAAGAGDAMTFGLTKVARRGVSWIARMGYGDNINYNGGWYWSGVATGTALTVLTGPKGPVFGFKGFYNNRGPLSPLLRVGFSEEKYVGLVFRGASGGTWWKTGISVGWHEHLFSIPMNGVRQWVGWLW